MDPEVISTKLALKAEYKWAAGAPRRTPKGTPLEGVYDATYCSFQLEHPAGLSLSDSLLHFCGQLRRHIEFLREVRSTGGTLEYFVGWFFEKNSGDTFNWLLLRDLAELQIDLSLDVYPSEQQLGRAKGRV